MRQRSHLTMTPRSQRGMTLIEVMIGMLIGMLILGGVLFAFLSSRQTYWYNDAVQRLQENGRIAIDIMVNDLHSSGFAGCRRLTNLDSDIRGRALLPADVQTAVGNDSITRPFVYAGVGAVANTDSFSVLGGGEPIPVSAAMASTSANITLDAAFAPLGNRLAVNNLALITDCQQADVFTVTGLGAATVSHAAFERTYNVGSILIPQFGTWINYYVRETPRVNQAGQPVRALYRQFGGNAAQELIEGVERMHIRYGIGDGEGFGPVQSYVAAAAVPDWRRVVSIRVQLLIATPENNVLTEIQPAIPFGDEGAADDFVPADRRFYQVFSTSIALRNRIK